MQHRKKRIAIFASGTGSNAQKIVSHFRAHPSIEVILIVSNKAQAKVLEMAQENSIDTWVISRESFYKSEDILKKLTAYSIDFVVLAGFLWLIPQYLVRQYKNRMVNIHPALLPKYGGKGMYGMNVHRAVKEMGETESGMTIHYVDEQYDEGNIIFQASCALNSEDTPESIAHKVLQLEHEHFAKVIENILEKTH